MLAHIMPTGANPDDVNPIQIPNPTPPIKNSEAILKKFLFIQGLVFSL